MQTYQNTKPTDIAWLGEVPEHWGVSKLGRILKPFSQKNHAHLPLLSITRELGVIERDVENQDENHNFIPDDLSGYKLLKKGQFGMNKMKAWQGSYGVSPYTGIVSPAYFIFDFTQEINPDFFHWAIRCKLYVSFFGSASDGVRVGQWDLSKSRMKEIPFVIPPLSEQTAIADFLDEKVAKIKDAISLKSEQIDKLKEYRQTLINQTVTQGLNPNALMKNSGVEWLGEVPSHWEVKKITHIFRKIGSGTTPTAGLSIYYDNGEINWLQTGDLNDGLISETSKKITPKAIKDFSSLKIYSPNSLVIAMYGATIGKVGLLNIYSTTNQACCVLGDGNNLEIKYIFYFFQAFKEKIVSMGYGGGQPNISQDLIKSLRICLPPLSEQTAIADFLDKKTTQIDTAIRQYQAEIDKLKEYQQSLVNEVVTGKVRVKQD